MSEPPDNLPQPAPGAQVDPVDVKLPQTIANESQGLLASSAATEQQDSPADATVTVQQQPSANSKATAAMQQPLTDTVTSAQSSDDTLETKQTHVGGLTTFTSINGDQQQPEVPAQTSSQQSALVVEQPPKTSADKVSSTSANEHQRKEQEMSQQRSLRENQSADSNFKDGGASKPGASMPRSSSTGQRRSNLSLASDGFSLEDRSGRPHGPVSTHKRPRSPRTSSRGSSSPRKKRTIAEQHDNSKATPYRAVTNETLKIASGQDSKNAAALPSSMPLHRATVGQTQWNLMERMMGKTSGSLPIEPLEPQPSPELPVSAELEPNRKAPRSPSYSPFESTGFDDLDEVRRNAARKRKRVELERRGVEYLDEVTSDDNGHRLNENDDEDNDEGNKDEEDDKNDQNDEDDEAVQDEEDDEDDEQPSGEMTEDDADSQAPHQDQDTATSSKSEPAGQKTRTDASRPVSFPDNLPLGVLARRKKTELDQDAADILRMMSNLSKAEPPKPDEVHAREKGGKKKSTWAGKVDGTGSTRPNWPMSAWMPKAVSDVIVESLGQANINGKKPPAKGAKMLRDIISFIKTPIVAATEKRASQQGWVSRTALKDKFPQHFDKAGLKPTSCLNNFEQHHWEQLGLPWLFLRPYTRWQKFDSGENRKETLLEWTSTVLDKPLKQLDGKVTTSSSTKKPSLSQPLPPKLDRKATMQPVNVSRSSPMPSTVASQQQTTSSRTEPVITQEEVDTFFQSMMERLQRILKAAEKNKLSYLASNISRATKEVGLYDELVRVRNQLPARQEDYGYNKLLRAHDDIEDQLDEFEQRQSGYEMPPSTMTSAQPFHTPQDNHGAASAQKVQYQSPMMPQSQFSPFTPGPPGMMQVPRSTVQPVRRQLFPSNEFGQRFANDRLDIDAVASGRVAPLDLWNDEHNIEANPQPK
jgi:hypothetical protein